MAAQPAQPAIFWDLKDCDLYQKIQSGDVISIKLFAASHIYGEAIRDTTSRARSRWGDLSGTAGDTSEHPAFRLLLQRCHQEKKDGGHFLGQEGCVFTIEYVFPAFIFTSTNS